MGAAFETIRSQGRAGATARVIARRGGFNQALIFYHFGSLDELQLAALDHIAAVRLDRYRQMLGDARDLPELVVAAECLFSEDLESGHSTVLVEMFAASVSNRELGRALLKGMEPWLDFTASLIRKVAGPTLVALVPEREAAQAALALYLGVELLAHLEGGSTRVAPLFAAGHRLAALLDPLIKFGGEIR